jgi:23S rRNA (cytosine1962-C5)-methyltransferase
VLLSDRPLFFVLTAYAIRTSALSMYYTLRDTMRDHGGTLTTGEMVLSEQSGNHLLSTAIFARWEPGT